MYVTFKSLKIVIVCKTLQTITIQRDKPNTNYTPNYNSCKTLQQITIHENITHVKHYKQLQSTKL
jgi:hypothetical protein